MFDTPNVLPCDRELAVKLYRRFYSGGTPYSREKILAGEKDNDGLVRDLAHHRHRQSAMPGRVDAGAMRDAAAKVAEDATRFTHFHGVAVAGEREVKRILAALAADIRALPIPPAPGEGAGSEWVLLPRVPTEAMLKAGEVMCRTQRPAGRVWARMLTAAGADGGVA